MGDHAQGFLHQALHAYVADGLECSSFRAEEAARVAELVSAPVQENMPGWAQYLTRPMRLFRCLPKGPVEALLLSGSNELAKRFPAQNGFWWVDRHYELERAQAGPISRRGAVAARRAEGDHINSRARKSSLTYGEHGYWPRKYHPHGIGACVGCAGGAKGISMFLVPLKFLVNVDVFR